MKIVSKLLVHVRTGQLSLTMLLEKKRNSRRLNFTAQQLTMKSQMLECPWKHQQEAPKTISTQTRYILSSKDFSAGDSLIEDDRISYMRRKTPAKKTFQSDSCSKNIHAQTDILTEITLKAYRNVMSAWEYFLTWFSAVSPVSKKKHWFPLMV